MSSILLSELHKHIEHVQALLAAASNDGSASSQYELRRRLRQIQACLDHQDLPDSIDTEEQQALLAKDLMAFLMTLEYECEDASVSELIKALVSRAAGLLASSTTTMTPTNDQLQGLFPRLLYLIQEQNTEQQSSEDVVLLESLLEFINPHLTVTRLPQVLDNPRDAWIALQLVILQVMALQKRVLSSQIQVQLRVLTGNLLEYWKEHILVDHESVEGWLQRHLLQQQSYASPDSLRQVVEAATAMLEHYGMELIETALQLMEEGARSRTPQTELESPAESSQQQYDDDDTLIALQHAVLATNFVLLMEDVFDNRMFGMTRSLWQALAAFCVDMTTEGDPDCHVAATHALWRMTQAQVQKRNSDAVIVVTTAMRLYDDEVFTSLATQQWVHSQLQNTQYGSTLRHALQATLLSSSLTNYLPDPTNQKAEHLATLAELVLNDDGEPSNDPWESFLREQLADHSSELQQQDQRQEDQENQEPFVDFSFEIEPKNR